MDDLAALDVASQQFGRQLAAVGDLQWTMATPCGDWTVSDLVRHINVGNRMSELLLAGADAATSIGPDAQPPQGANPTATYAATSAAQIAAFAKPGALTITVKHPAMEMPGELLLMFRTLDLAMHAWDLASGIDSELNLDAEMCASVWERLEPLAPLLSGSGMFGTPQRNLGPDASVVDVLLNATGR
jgi:uncharacterized protein (TIGR03086 family)